MSGHGATTFASAVEELLDKSLGLLAGSGRVLEKGTEAAVFALRTCNRPCCSVSRRLVPSLLASARAQVDGINQMRFLPCVLCASNIPSPPPWATNV